MYKIKSTFACYGKSSREKSTFLAFVFVLGCS